MSDNDIRSLERRARESGEPADFARWADALVRVRRIQELVVAVDEWQERYGLKIFPAILELKRMPRPLAMLATLTIAIRSTWELPAGVYRFVPMEFDLILETEGVLYRQAVLFDFTPDRERPVGATVANEGDPLRSVVRGIHVGDTFHIDTIVRGIPVATKFRFIPHLAVWIPSEEDRAKVRAE